MSSIIVLALIVAAIIFLYSRKKANGNFSEDDENISFEVNGKKLFEDESFLVIKSSYFNHALLVYFFGTVFVQLKATSKIVKLTHEERKVMIAVVGELAQLGIRHPDPRFDNFMHEFCSVVMGRGTVLWKMMITHNSPQETARAFS